MLAHIIKWCKILAKGKSLVQKLVDKIAGIFVPIVIVIAAASFIVWNILVEINVGFTQGLLALLLHYVCPVLVL
ncbi:MAG: hypothetical protein IPO02_02535 [Bacteroidetes bacterium]|nr:hypothetical protein [Bacteroidota bacterium]